MEHRAECAVEASSSPVTKHARLRYQELNADVPELSRSCPSTLSGMWNHNKFEIFRHDIK
jgi:hypothetical protein